MKPLAYAVLSTLFGVAQCVEAVPVFQESDGLVTIEMESTFGQPLGEWVPGSSVDPQNQTGSGYLEFTGNDPEQGPPTSPLEYLFKINKSGVYSLHLHCAKLNQELNGKMRKDVANDVYVRVDGTYQARNPKPDDFPDAKGQYRKMYHKQDAPLDLLKVDTKFYGGAHQKFVWTQSKNSNGSASESLDPGGHNNKRGAYYRFLAGETYRLTFHGRSRDFMINRILFRHEDAPFSAATDLSNPESATLNADPFPAMDHRLTVKGGFGNGHYAAGQLVAVRAAPAPEGKVFGAWTGDIATVADAASAETTLEMPETDLTLTASYTRDPATLRSYTFDAVTDFVDITSGEIPFYIDRKLKALAINAAKEKNRGPVARATMIFEGDPDVYDVTLSTMGEEDGDCTYKLFVNDECVGEVSNKSTEKDFEAQSHAIALSVEIPAGATLAVESSAVTNGKIPEKGGTAWARGRWTGLTLQSAENAPLPKPSDRFRHAPFDRSRDLLLIQYDGRPDADDVHAQAAAGSLLSHKEMADIKTYAVHNAWGKQKSKDIWNSVALMTLAFGPENDEWTNAYTLDIEQRTNPSSNWYQSVQRIADRVQAILEAGGKVWVAEAGQSDITKDWVVELFGRGVSADVVKSSVIIVQHSQWNEDQTSPGVLAYLKTHTTYVHIDDGNDGHNGTPNYHTDKDAATIAAHSEIRKKAVSANNPVEATRAMWREADKIIGDWKKGYSRIDEGGFDFSDTVEVWWILDLGEAVDTIPEFADAYIFQNSAMPGTQTLLVSAQRSDAEELGNLKSNFKNPSQEYGVNCWWWWLNGNVTKEAITKDLEAMKSKNFQGAMVFDAGGHNQRGNHDIPAGPLYGSDEWNELFVFALDEARRLGLEIGFNIQSGWNLGGPGVTPQYAAKQLVYTETRISGGAPLDKSLKQPKALKGFYKDIAVLAFPLDTAEKTTNVISDLKLKLGYKELGMSAPDTRFLLGNQSQSIGKRKKKSDSRKKSTVIIQRGEVRNITSRMDAAGTLSWDAPKGEWCVLRIGYTTTRAHVSTSSAGWQGRVLDYMSKEAFAFYWNDVVEPILKRAGSHVGTTLKFMETDSWECKGMNWTDDFSAEFKQYRGYDITPYLPLVAGYIIDDLETSHAFLADFRKTLGDLVAYNHYAEFQKYAHRYNMGIQPESAGPHAGPLDGIKNYGFSDLMMSEFWAPSPHRPTPDQRFFVKQASSAAHINGVKIVGAEAFTTIGPHWNDELWHDLKSSFDHEICAGLNRTYFHTFTCSPAEMGLPGQEYFAGTHVNPQVTWWEQSDGFIDYMRRTQSVVQNGLFVADVLYYYGDHVPNVFPHKHADPAGAMPGFDYDVTDETILLQLTVDQGEVVVPSGLRYKVLVLPDHGVLSLAALRKVEALLQSGATVVGNKAGKLVSLVGGENAQRDFQTLADAVWGEGESDQGERRYGKGTIAWGCSARDFLLSKGVAADFKVLGNDSKTDYDYIHYTLGDSDVYFVSNQSAVEKEVRCQFRIVGRQPELWDALTGEIVDARAFSQKSGLTTIPLKFDPYGTAMVIFSRPIPEDQQGGATQNHPAYKTVKELTGSWEVHFDPEWGGPASVVFPELIDWSRHSDDGIKYYSGKAVYHKTVTLDAAPRPGRSYVLELGRVKDVGIAEVKINGVDKGLVWAKPFRVDVSDVLKKGENTLEINVINSWYNRVAGDQLFPAKKKYTKTNINLKIDCQGKPRKTIPLEPSGLLGPVIIKEEI